MVGMLLERANEALSTMTTPQGARPKTLLPAHLRGVCVWGNHSSSQVLPAGAGVPKESCFSSRCIPSSSSTRHPLRTTPFPDTLSSLSNPRKGP